jgi:hypothetical protein
VKSRRIKASPIAASMFLTLTLALGVHPAWANDLTSGTVTADCNGYAVTVNANNLTPQTAYTADYNIQLSGCVSPTASLPGQLAIVHNVSDQTLGTGSASAAWGNGLTLNGTCTVSGTATLTQNPSSSVTLTPLPTNPLTFACTPPPPPCSGVIGDFVWNDLNRDGLQDVGEPGIDGVRLTLTDSSGHTTAVTTPTNGTPGSYLFTGLCAGSYTVTVDQTTVPPGFKPTTCGVGGDSARDSNCSGAVTLPTNNSSDLTIDFGYVLSGKTFSIGPSSMEGNLTILPGDWISGGFSFAFKAGGHGATNYSVASTASLDVTCPKGGGSGGTITVDLGTKSYPVPAGNTNWLPTGDANSVLSWMGSARAPDLCNGYPMNNSKGAVFKATVSQNPPTGSLVAFRFKYRDPNAKGKGNVNCLDTSDPRRAKADVCGASWSQTVTDP